MTRLTDVDTQLAEAKAQIELGQQQYATLESDHELMKIAVLALQEELSEMDAVHERAQIAEGSLAAREAELVSLGDSVAKERKTMHAEWRRLSAELEAAKAALEAFRDAWRYSVHMSGPKFSGFNHSALMRAVPLTEAALGKPEGE